MQIAATFAALAREHNGRLDKAQTLGLLRTLRLGESESEGQRSEAAEALWTEMGLAEDAFITQARMLFVAHLSMCRSMQQECRADL